MPDRGLWSYKYHLDGRDRPNQSLPSQDVFYSLNVLLGLSKAPVAAREAFGADPSAMFDHVVSQLRAIAVPRYAYGTALWAAAELGTSLPSDILDRIRRMAGEPELLRRWRAQELGMLLSGIVAQARCDATWVSAARMVKGVILANLTSASGLFRDSAVGFRRYFGSFATQVYCMLGLYQYAEATGDGEAARTADRCVTQLLALQGPRGEWPWFFHIGSGRVADFYEVYSVHQHGMAPAFLKHGVMRGIPGARDALVKGFAWILGENQLGRTMVRPDLSLIARSQARAGLAGRRGMRFARSCFSGLTGRAAELARPANIIITPEVRSYELGWILWSFGDDSNFPELTHHQAFQAEGNGGVKGKPGRVLQYTSSSH
jgi:hypothetical protein